jgi:hypothetical protein
VATGGGLWGFALWSLYPDSGGPVVSTSFEPSIIEQAPKERRRFYPKTAVYLNSVVGLLGFAAGIAVALSVGARIKPPSPTPSFWLSDFLAILASNERVMLSMVLGLPSLGIYGNFVVAYNCYRFGADCAAILRTSTSDAICIAIHGPLEMAVFILGAAAIQEIAWSAVRTLISRDEFFWHRPVRRFAAAVFLLIPVAGIELASKWARGAGLL